ncbi:MAG TPA: reverse gyrase [Euryarchaeota archaeon]|nr:reverse gyrase [Euryarchaeota archaeon]
MGEKADFVNLCPNCEGEITDARLRVKNPCRACLPEEVAGKSYEETVVKVYEALAERGKTGKYQTVYEVVSRLADFNGFFRRAVGSGLWSAQRTWAKRVFLGRSFSIVAPTGIGKTAFGMALALYLAGEGEKIYFVLPTSTLLHQVHARLKEYAERTGASARILCIHGKMGKKERAEANKALKEGNFEVLVTTSQFLARNFDSVRHIRFDLVFVDDVDSFLRASRNIERVLILLGFTEEVIRDAYELVRAKYSLLFRPRDRELRKKVEELQRKIDEFKKGRTGQLIVASATGRARGLRVKLFRELLEFEIGSTRANLRNVINSYTEMSDPLRQAADIAKKLGKGGLVFVPVDGGLELAEKTADALNRAGVRAVVASSENAERALEALEKGEADVAVGVAAYYGVLVRGIDLPEVIRYAVFVGVPRFKFTLNFENAPPGQVAYLLDAVADVIDDEKRSSELRRLANTIRRRRNEEDVEKGRRILQEILSDREVLRKLEESREVAVVEEGGVTKILIADPKTYIQATGRTSRMYAGGITPGFSVVIVDDERIFNQLRRYLRFVLDEEFVPLGELDLEEVRRKLEEGRKKKKKAAGDPVKTVLFVVESPNKARTIARFFGTPSTYRIGEIKGYEVATGRYILNIVATRGHVFDLTTDRGFHGVIVGKRFVPVYTTIKLCRNCGAQTVENECPSCGSSDYLEDAIWRVNALRVFALESDFAIIGTDPDREGEKIAWDVALAINPYVPTIARAEFHEVTRSAILRALEATREINERLVESQIVRRIEDRWIGFELSRKLWEAFNNNTLSAGRVQTPVLGWVVKRYEEHRGSVKVFLDVRGGGARATFETGFRTPKEAREYAKGRKLVVRVASRREEEVHPAPPFSTDSMLREAGDRMGIGPREIMDLAQDLFEAGLITYHRTDSTHVSPAGMSLAREYIAQRFGEEYYRGRQWGEEGAHECIRPTKPMDTDALVRLLREGELNIQGLTKKHLYLYSIIFERFIASQMREAVVRRAEVEYRLGELEKTETVNEKIVRDGWTAIRRLPVVRVVEGEFEPESVRAYRMATIPLYSQADLVALMKEKGIGRPSTYATIIQKLLDRRYVLESKEKKRLIPTQLGIKVYSFLTENYAELVSEERTRELEETLDAVAEGKKDYQEAIRETYEEIRALVSGKG